MSSSPVKAPVKRILMWANTQGTPAPHDIATLRAEKSFKVVDITAPVALVEGDEAVIESFATKNGWNSFPLVEYSHPQMNP